MSQPVAVVATSEEILSQNKPIYHMLMTNEKTNSPVGSDNDEDDDDHGHNNHSDQNNNQQSTVSTIISTATVQTADQSIIDLSQPIDSSRDCLLDHHQPVTTNPNTGGVSIDLSTISTNNHNHNNGNNGKRKLFRKFFHKNSNVQSTSTTPFDTGHNSGHHHGGKLLFAYENLNLVDDISMDELSETNYNRSHNPLRIINEANACDGRSNGGQFINRQSSLNSTARVHCHDGVTNGKEQTQRRSAIIKLIYGLTMCTVFMLIELVGGYLSHSLAIFTDAAHLTSDMISFAISLFAILCGQRRPTQSKSFGYHRIEVLGVLMSVFIIWMVTGVLIYLAIERMIDNQFELNSVSMLVVSCIGLAMNLLMWLVLSGRFQNIICGMFAKLKPTSENNNHSSTPSSLPAPPPPVSHSDQSAQSCSIISSSQFEQIERQQSVGDDHWERQTSHNHHHQHNGTLQSHHGHSHMNMNVRAAIIHIIGDMIQSVGVLVAAIIVHLWPNLKIADPICTLVFGVLVFATTYSILTDVLHILMEGFPSELSYRNVKQLLMDHIPELCHVHSLHVWSLSHGNNVLTVHLTVADDRPPLDDGTPANSDTPLATNAHFENIRIRAEQLIRAKLGIGYTTIQVEYHQDSAIKQCQQCRDPNQLE